MYPKQFGIAWIGAGTDSLDTGLVDIDSFDNPLAGIQAGMTAKQVAHKKQHACL